MCSPTAGVMGIQALGSGISAYGAESDGDAKNAYYHALADTNDKQADAIVATAGRNQTSVQADASRQVQQVRNEGQAVAGSQRVAMAVNGIGADSSTAEDVASDTFSRQKMDELAIRYSADSKTREIGNEATQQYYDLKNQGNQYRVAGYQAQRAGNLGMLSSLVGGAGSMGATYLSSKAKV